MNGDNMRNLPPRIRKRLHEYSMQAYENELKSELEKLNSKFKAWENRDICSGELSNIIYHWANGVCKELFKRYNDSMKDMNVAYAIAAGILKKENIDKETLEHLSNAIAFYEQHLKEDLQPAKNNNI